MICLTWRCSASIQTMIYQILSQQLEKKCLDLFKYHLFIKILLYVPLSSRGLLELLLLDFLTKVLCLDMFLVEF